MGNKHNNFLDVVLNSNQSANTPLSSLLIDGQQAYKSKQYEKALQYYSEAIDNARDQACDFIHLYELRSGVYAKLKQMDLALQDARKMVRLDRKDARGYIRCGQIEQLCNDIPSAIRFYQHGLKNVTASDPLYRQLEARFQKTRELASDKSIFEKATDPLRVLPAELLEMVFSHMSYRQLVGFLRVSKMWKDRLCSLDLLRHTIDFSEGNTKAVPYACMNAALKRLGKGKKRVSLSNLSGPAAELVKAHLQRWINWEGLEHFQVNRINTAFDALRWDKYRLKTVEFGETASIQVQTVVNILKSSPNLQKAIFQNVVTSKYLLDLNTLPHNEKLEILQINSNGLPGKQSVSVPTKWMYPNIRRLRMGGVYVLGRFDFSSCSGLIELDFRACNFQFSPGPGGFIGPPRVEFLHLDFQSACMIEPMSGYVGLNMSLEHLSDLRVYGHGNTPFTFHLLVDVGLRPNQLKHLSIRPDTQGGGILPPISYDALESLVLQHVDLTDDMSTDFAKWFPNILTLDISSTEITGAFIGDLLRRPGNKIRSLVLRFCQKISIDTIAWARERGVNVKVIQSDGRSDGGRRVRYE